MASQRNEQEDDWRIPLTRLGEPKIGTGFFLNVPASEWYVVLTAAHNLVDEDGNESENLLVESWERTYAAKDIAKIDICPHYGNARGNDKTKGQSANVDYGAILISRASGSPNIGFGFSLEAKEILLPQHSS